MTLWLSVTNPQGHDKSSQCSEVKRKMSGKLVKITDRVLDGWALGQLGNLLKEVVSWTLIINRIYQGQKGVIESYKTLIKEGGSKQVHLSSPIRSQGFSCLGFYNCVSRSHSQAGKLVGTTRDNLELNFYISTS